MARENAHDKGKRLLGEGRLKVDAVSGDGHRFPIVATCKGDSGTRYSLGYDRQEKEWRCTCPARGKCAHLWALQLVTEAPA